MAVGVELSFNVAIYPVSAEKNILKSFKNILNDSDKELQFLQSPLYFTRTWSPLSHCTWQNLSPRFVSPEVGQMENISPGQIIDEPIRPVNIPRKEKDFQGMLEYKREDEQKLVKNLILGKCFLRG